jgi:hypothetical protein
VRFSLCNIYSQLPLFIPRVTLPTLASLSDPTLTANALTSPLTAVSVVNTRIFAQSRAPKMAVANNPRLATTANAPHTLPAARKPAFHFHGPMAVMTSPTVDKTPLDLKASAFAPADAMAVDTTSEANG